ncbi:hypothetical protein [Streptomyces sp. NBC_00986]|uniref:hypothetical protein n=1 Tax=Streptomyces sp. NBC_00986 TaxID=2903702 RepID=UPI00386EE119|nr:hypothetical protein OG504_20195 [Streptomyces sp. NBC_00986]
MSKGDDVPNIKTENDEARLELLMAIKQGAETVRIDQVQNGTYRNGHAALLALSQAWAALQPSSEI